MLVLRVAALQPAELDFLQRAVRVALGPGEKLLFGRIERKRLQGVERRLRESIS